MEKINIAELLKDCPKGMELDCTMFDNVTFEGLNTADYPINIKVMGDDCYKYLTKSGCWNNNDNAKCVIFPKGKTTWEGFKRPFEDGDILTYTSNHTTTFIYRNKDNEPNYSTSFYVACNNAPSNNFLIYNKYALIALNGNCDVRLATEEEKQKLFQAIKNNGYKWNPKTKTLEKLIVPKFKVGDRIKKKDSDEDVGLITDIADDYYIVETKYGMEVTININIQNNYKLVPNKFDITTLKPFEKVLVRQNVNGKWGIDFFGFYTEGYYYTTGSCIYVQCIPYEGNEHLLGTTNDCDEYFKNW